MGGRARTGDIAPEELTGSTFTITNIGSFGALFDTPIINQPNVAILGTGSIVKRPMVVKDVDGNDSIAIRSMCYLSLTYDHRVVMVRMQVASCTPSRLAWKRQTLRLSSVSKGVLA